MTKRHPEGGETTKRLTFGAAVVLSLMAAAFQAQALEEKLVVVTSYPPDTTETVKAAFQKVHPGIQVEMLKTRIRHVAGLRGAGHFNRTTLFTSPY